MLGPVFPNHAPGPHPFCRRFKEPTMAKSILASLAVLTLVTSAALAATDETTTHHRHAAKTSAAAPAAAAPTAAAPASPVVGAFPSFWGVSAADHEMYIKNQHELRPC